MWYRHVDVGDFTAVAKHYLGKDGHPHEAALSV